MTIPISYPVTAPTTDPSMTFFNKRQVTQDVHRLLLAVAELQARVIELEKVAPPNGTPTPYTRISGPGDQPMGGYVGDDGNPGV